MKENFEKFIPEILKSEGGYDDRPSNEDPGGATNYGIIRQDLADYYKRPLSSISKSEIKNLSKDTAIKIYKALYWDKIKGDDLPSGIDVCVFDLGLLAGNGTAIRKLQEAIGTTVDGAFGINSIKAMNLFIEKNGMPALIEKYSTIRQKYLASLKNAKYNPGWVSRTVRVKNFAMELIK